MENMAVIESGEYRTARKAIAADPIMRKMVREFWIDAASGKVDADIRYSFGFMMNVAKAYYARGGKVDGYGMGDHQKAFNAFYDEVDARIRGAVA